MIIKTEIMHKDQPVVWFILGSIITTIQYYWKNGFKFEIIQVSNTYHINWHAVGAHAFEAALLAVIGGCCTYLGKEVTRHLFRKIKNKIFNPKNKLNGRNNSRMV